MFLLDYCIGHRKHTIKHEQKIKFVHIQGSGRCPMIKRSNMRNDCDTLVVREAETA
jgi:hypothetical protein